MEFGSILFLGNLILTSDGCFWKGFDSLKNSTLVFWNKFDSTLPAYQNDSKKPDDNFPIPYDHQVAGHEYFYSGANSKLGLMKEADGHLLKPAIDPKYGAREISFYERIKTAQDLELQELGKYIPKYNGTVVANMYGKNITFIRMEDITKNFKLPCVMDLKIGQQTWEPQASMGKIIKDSLMSPAMKTIWGFSITGLKYYDIKERTFVKHDKMHYIMRMFFHEAIQELYNFLNGEIGIDCGLVRGILQQLERIRSWFERQTQLSFFDTSLLFAYDAEPLLDNIEAGRSCNNNSLPEIRIRMIDFSHAIPNTNQNDVDVNYLTSLRKLIHVFENLKTWYANAYTNGMMMRILRIFSLNELFLYYKQVL